MMKYFRTRIVSLPILALLSGCLASPSLFGQGRTPTVNRVALLGSESGLQLQIRSNIPVATQSQVLTGPDRIVIDFLGALPGNALRGFAVHQAGVRAVRVGLFESTPPRTRVVIDLDRPIAYQILPQANAVLVTLGSSSAPVTSSPALITVSDRHPVHVDAKVTPPQPVPPLQVTYNNGLLWVDARKATLAEVLYQIHLRTGADIPIPAGAEQERVVMSAGPGPAKDVMATLLNGSRFNFVIVGAAQDQKELRSVILTPKTDSGGYDQVISATQPSAAQPQPPPQPQPEAEVPQPEIPQPDPSAQMQTQPVPQETPVTNQGQVIPAPTAPPPPPTEEPNRPWTEPPPTTPQPE